MTSYAKAALGFAILAVLDFAIFAVAGFGWTAGAALARLIGGL